MAKVNPIPKGYHTVTPHLLVSNASRALEFYKKALGAEELYRMPAPDGKIMHAEMRIGDSVIMLADPMPQSELKPPDVLGGTPASLLIYTNDVDQSYKRAIDAGATPRMPPEDMFWGDRYATLTDPFGHNWALATHVEDVSPDEMSRRAAKLFSK